MKNQEPGMIGRRSVLRSGLMAAGAVVISQTLPTDLFTSSNESELFAQMFEHSGISNPFIAHAETGTWLEPVRLQNTQSAFMGIYERLGLDTLFSNRVDYKEAAQCTDCFKKHEDIWRPYYNRFTDVERPSVDNDVAYMLAGNVDVNSRMYIAEGSTQFEDRPAVALVDDDPAILIVASNLLGLDQNPTRKERAQSLTLTKKASLADKNSERRVGTIYETPVSHVAHIRYPPRDSSASRFTRGMIAVRNKRNSRNANSVYYAGLYV